MAKVVVQILQGSVVTQTTVDGYASYGCEFPVVYICQNYENRLTVGKVIVKISGLVLAHPVE